MFDNQQKINQSVIEKVIRIFYNKIKPTLCQNSFSAILRQKKSSDGH